MCTAPIVLSNTFLKTDEGLDFMVVMGVQLLLLPERSLTIIDLTIAKPHLTSRIGDWRVLEVTILIFFKK